MNFVECVGKLMASSGLTKLMGSTFGGLSKMHIGKEFPMNVMALCFVVLELLHGLADGIVDYDDFFFFLYSLAIKSYLAEHWMNTLIKPVLIMMKLMGSTFGGLSKIHIGKKFPMNVRALCLVVLQLLCGLVDEIVLIFSFIV